MGKYFKAADEFYKIYVPYFKLLLGNPEVADKIREKELSLQFIITDLKAQILLDCCNALSPLVCGQTPAEGDIKIWMKSDSAHHLWLGKISLMNAIMVREIKVQGPVEKLKELTSIFKPATAIYKQHLINLNLKEFLN
jgi:alkyl sulfatase BDS1-like metallo-beta-lactamase superfamily hydrolase